MTHINNITINTEKIENNKKILSLSDLHATKKVGLEHLSMIKRTVNMDEIDQIAIPGDIVNDVNELKNNKFRNGLLKALSDFAEGKDVFVSFGNHDLMTLGKHGWEEGNYLLLEETLQELSNFHLLHNGEKITVDNITYSAFSPNFSYYEDEKKKRRNLESPSDYRRAFFENYNGNLFSNDTFNILLTHEPQSIIKLSTKKGSCIQDNTDLVVSGHMHDGMVPHILKGFFGNKGIISPQRQLLPNYARGVVEIDGTNFIINGAVNTMVENSLINEIYGANATVIDLQKVKKRESLKTLFQRL